MALLAKHSERRFTNRQIADVLEASGHHLAKVMQRLAKERLVNSIRGPQGGFVLAKPAEQVSLLEIFEAIEGPVGKVVCLSENPVCHGEGCVLGRVVQSVQAQLLESLSGTTLAELAESFSPLAAIPNQVSLA